VPAQQQPGQRLDRLQRVGDAINPVPIDQMLQLTSDHFVPPVAGNTVSQTFAAI
jgi:hypothetical protein